MKTAIRLVCLLICLPLGAFDRTHQEKQRQRPTSDVEYWAGIFDDPARKEWQKPITVLTFLGIQNGAVVADLGSGSPVVWRENGARDSSSIARLCSRQ